MLNLAGLVALLLGFLYLNQFREGLIGARVQSLLTQGEIIAAAIAASATVETDTITLDPDRLLQLQTGETLGLGDDSHSFLEFSINPERVAPLLRKLVTPTRTRARLYDREGMILLDSRSLNMRGDVMRFNLPPLKSPETSLVERLWHQIMNIFSDAKQIGLEEIGPTNGRSLEEVQKSLLGVRANSVRLNNVGETIVSVAVPIQRQRVVQGSLLLSTQGGDIDQIIVSERFALFQIFFIASLVMIVLSVLLARAIANPMHHLADAADKVRRGVKLRQEIPDYTYRSDEVGHLSGALRDMTSALYNRIEAIESFAADVAHELKNPLTSLRSAVDTLPLARESSSKSRLIEVIQHDVKRLDRLISDISDASRLDAELARQDSKLVDVRQLVEAVVSLTNDVSQDHEAKIEIITHKRTEPKLFYVLGHDQRLGQVLRNVLDNARSFSPSEQAVQVTLSRQGKWIELTVEDHGPGIPSHALERIFERFYTDRPHQGFGQNSGLGLSISYQIVKAHHGTITAENRKEGGARFTIKLPAQENL